MTVSGWMVMLVSIGGVTLFFLWCIWKVLSTKGETGHIHGFEVEPKDVEAGRDDQEKR